LTTGPPGAAILPTAPRRRGLHNLESLPADGFTIACFLVKIRGTSAGWTRAVAILERQAAVAER